MTGGSVVVAEADPAPEFEAPAGARRRSESSLKNDALILDAASRAIFRSGVDGLAISTVARGAGLTTGALYGRYESTGELAAAVWTRRVRDRHFTLLDGAIRALLDDGDPKGLDELLRELSTPTPETMVALELLATARRVDELEEVVLSDVRLWTQGWGAGPRVRARRRRAQVVYTLGTVWGVLLHAAPGKRRLDWRPLFRSLGQSFARPCDEPVSRLVPDEFPPVHAETDDPVEDALVDAVAAIVARVGLARATGSRIARRAGLTSGAIYGRYATKEDLLEHAIEILLARRFADDIAGLGTVIGAADPAGVTARIVAGYLTDSRREWRRFRIEAHLAGRSHPGIAATLDGVQERAKRDYLDTIGARTAKARRDLDGLARAAMLQPIGLAFADLVLPAVPAVDWRLVLGPLFAPHP